MTGPDSRSTSAPGESRNGHFQDAALTAQLDDSRRSTMAAVIANRKADNDSLTFPGFSEYDD